jgi:hypothetical protein
VQIQAASHAELPTAVEFYVKKLGFQQALTWGEPPTFAA